jgi:Uma2 family endonuclease
MTPTSAPTKQEATVADLARAEGKAELFGGNIVPMSPTGGKSGRVAGRIFIALDEFERETGLGYAFGDNVGFLVDLPNRKSFSPDAAFFVGELFTPEFDDGDFVNGAPALAVEVRSKNDFGETMERRIAAKITDYFAAGTLVVWDVDPLREQVIRVYRASSPETPTIYRRGDTAEAEPAVPGWTMPVNDLFA